MKLNIIFIPLIVGFFMSVKSESTIAKIPWIKSTDKISPVVPEGGTLIEWAPCQNSKLANPAIINQSFLNGSEAKNAYVVQHGALNDFDSLFTSLFDILGNTAPIISPGFLTADGESDFWRKDMHLGWRRGIEWVIGNDDITGANCSSFSQYDAILNYLDKNPSKFPNIQKIILLGHSGGGNLISRFSTINTNTPKPIRYIIANAAHQAYFDDARPINTTTKDCPSGFRWPYQWNGSFNKYVGARTEGRDALFQRWADRDVIHLTGEQDKFTKDRQTCQSMAQGGSTRRDRNYAYWAYLNILAGTKTNVSKYKGYQQLLSSGAKKIGNGHLAHQSCKIAGVGHDASKMFSSECGKAAIFGKSLPAGEDHSSS